MHSGKTAVSERNAYIALNMMEGIGPVTVRTLASSLGSVQAVLEADESALVQANGVGHDLARKILEQRGEVDPEGEIERASAIGACIITPLDEEYPRQLKEIHDPPLALYILGRLESKDQNSIAVVGTRRATHYGRDSAERLSYELAQAGFVVVSGLALGIDTAAHKGALKAGGRTIGVIGSGLDCIYPSENRTLAKEIAECGAVISEFTLGRQPDKTSFPIRNRIISGMSLGTVVVQAGTTSGAMITASQALEQGRSVFAVPGRIDSHASRGPHRLIRDGARLIENVDDVIDELQFLLPGSASLRAENTRNASSGGLVSANALPAVADLSEHESRLVSMLTDDAMDVDSMIRESGLKPATVSSTLIGLEMKKIIRMLPGRMVELRRR